MLRVEVVKGLVLFCLFVMTFGLGIFPVKLVKMARRRSASQTSRQVKYKRLVSLFSCYAAGVFLATCLLDLFPDVRDKLTNVLDSAQIYTVFPVPEFVMVSGLFIILIAEQIVLVYKERKDSEVTRPLLRHASAKEDEHASVTRSGDFSKHSFEGICDRPRSFSSPSVSTGPSVNINRANRDMDREPLLGVSHSNDDHSHVIETEIVMDPAAPDHSALRSLLLLLALSLHSIFEGLAVGLQQKSADVLAIFAALALHKSILSFSLGLSLVQSQLSSGGIIRSILAFSLASPLGIGIGLCITDLTDSFASHLAEGILQGIACGTFLYVTFFEMLPHEFNTSQDRLLKVLFVLFGYGTVAVLVFFHNTNGQKPVCPSVTTTTTTSSFPPNASYFTNLTT